MVLAKIQYIHTLTHFAIFELVEPFVEPASYLVGPYSFFSGRQDVASALVYPRICIGSPGIVVVRQDLSLLSQFSSNWLNKAIIWSSSSGESGCNVFGLGGDGDGDEREVLILV